MGILNRLFGGTEAIAKEIELDDESIIRHWQDYKITVPEKELIISRLPFSFGQRRSLLQKLQQLLKLELVTIGSEEKEEEELISDLASLEHNQRIRRIHRLDDCLAYVETKHEYIYELLRHLYFTLKSESKAAKNLASDLKKFRRQADLLGSEFKVEQELLAKIDARETFHDMFTALVKGEHTIQRMNSREKRLIAKMQAGMNKIFARELGAGVTYKWAIQVYNAVQDIVTDQEALLAKGYDPHENVDFEFVNGSKFVDLARKTISIIRLSEEKEFNQRMSVLSLPKKKEISEQMIRVFVHIFREWYNYGRD